MTCSLCNLEKPLIKKSHIIPDFMYKGLFCEKHFIHYTNLTSLNPSKRLPDGIYDQHILCKSCDNDLLGSLETYASKTFYSMGNYSENEKLTFESKKGDDGLTTIFIGNLDYKKYKLFLLSILWRAHISKHPFFKVVNLGSYAERLRKMILTNDPGEEDDFEFALVLITPEEVVAKSIIEPRYLKDEGNSNYVFCINEIMYHFNISKYNKMPMFAKSYLGKDNIMQVAVPEKKIANEYFDAFLGKKIRLKKNK